MIALGSIADGRRLPVFLCAAVALHAVLAGLLFSQVEASPHRAERVWSISLLPTTGQSTRPLAPDMVTPPAAATAGTPAVVEPVASSTTEPPLPVAAVGPVSPSEARGVSSSMDRLGEEEPAAYFYSASELTRLPGLPGDPVIDLGGTSEEVVGNIELRLFIDSKGKVVKKQAEGSSDLPPGIVDAVTRAFVGYPYVPGQRQGIAVNSQVVLIIRVSEGQVSNGVTQEFSPN